MSISNLAAVALLELKRIWNNKRLLVILVISPIVTCIAFGFVAYRNPEAIDTTVFVERPRLATVDSEIQHIISEIDNYEREDGSGPFSVTVEQNSLKDALQKLDEGKTRAVIIFTQSQDGLQNIEVIIDVTETIVTNELTQILPKIVSKYSKETSITRLTEFLVEHEGLALETANREATRIIEPFEVSIKTNAWRDLKYFDFYASAMIMILTMAIPLSLSLIAITSERSRGTMERIFVSPYGKMEIITGKMLAYSIFAIVFAVLITITLKATFNIALGNIGLVLLTSILIGINGVILGLLVSSVTSTEAESVIVGILLIFAIMGLVTYMVPWETMQTTTRFISHLVPYTYGIQAIRSINMTGARFIDIWPGLAILFGAIIVQLFVAIPVLRREIK